MQPDHRLGDDRFGLFILGFGAGLLLGLLAGIVITRG